MKTYNYPPTTSMLDNIYGQTILKSDPLKIFPYNVTKKGSKTFRINVPRYKLNYIVTQDPKLIDYVTQKNNKNYQKSDLVVNTVGKYVGYGLLTNNGEDWFKQRRLIQPGFSKAKIEALSNTILEETQKVMANATLNTEFDMYGLMNLLAFRIVASTLFGASLTDEQLIVLCQKITHVQEVATKEISKPEAVWWLQLSGQLTKAKAISVEVMDTMRMVLAERRKATGEFSDLLSMLMDARYEDTGEPMTDEKLVDEMTVIFLAGHETTANALSWIIYLLSKNPQAKTKLIEEIDQLQDKAYAVENLVKPSYAMACINEGMRCFPPAWAIDRVALIDDQFENYSWEKGTVIISNFYGVHHDADLWESPDKFDPERFMVNKKLPDNFYPFGAGPRMCIGNHFALMEMVIVIRYLYSNFDFELKQDKIKKLALVTLRPDSVKGVLTKK